LSTPALGVFFEDKLIRVFSKQQTQTGVWQIGCNFLDLKKITELGSSDDAFPADLNVTSRYFAHSLKLPPGSKKVFLIGDQENFHQESARMAFGDSSDPIIMRQIDRFLDKDGRLSLHEQALLSGLLDVLKNGGPLVDFDFLQATEPPTKYGKFKQVADSVALKAGSVALLFIATLYFKTRCALATDTVRQVSMAEHRQLQRELENLQKNLADLSRLQAEQSCLNQLLIRLPQQLAGLKICLDSVQLIRPGDHPPLALLEIKGRYRGENAAELHRELQIRCAASLPEGVETNIRISTEANNSGEYIFSCQIPLTACQTLPL
jgi:hypothetical protein